MVVTYIRTLAFEPAASRAAPHPELQTLNPAPKPETPNLKQPETMNFRPYGGISHVRKRTHP